MYTIVRGKETPGGDIMLEKLYSYFLNVYEDKDFITRQKVKVIFVFMITCVPVILVLVGSIVIISGFDPGIFYPPIIGITIFIIMIYMIKKGYYVMVAHAIPIVGLASMWATMFLEKGSIVERLDTVAIILGFLSFTTLIVTKRRLAIIAYFIINIMIFVACALYLQQELEFSNDLLVEYIIDTTVGICIIGVTSYQVFVINKKALEKAEEETRKNVELNHTLEQKVEERTEELQGAMHELQAMNEQVVETRDELWGEMELAKKIQTTLLPPKPEIRGYEIAAYMSPADEVGGDYYDIINVAGRDWIVIGDVSGHGVTAGLIMMMVQTSIQVALSQNPDVEPSKLLTIINKTLFKNITLLGEFRYMTITVLACHDEGHFYFAGLHQDIMVYREAKEATEVVETGGMWIGLMDNIDGMIDVDKMKVHAGDVILLYTDGITEAWRTGSVKDQRTMDEDMFGQHRLRETFTSLGKEPVHDIKDGILDALKGYECGDDVTMVVMKRVP
ncbi:MAG: PP2C family protein-serine/threonine phosphatase [bacterium]|nr:PP2C family protein-serine/threonine phosphatase [bacterium]